MEQILTNGALLGQLGVGAIFFIIYWVERKENKEASREMRDAYINNTKAFEGLANAVNNNTRATDSLVSKVDSIFNNGKQ